MRWTWLAALFCADAARALHAPGSGALHAPGSGGPSTRRSLARTLPALVVPLIVPLTLAAPRGARAFEKLDEKEANRYRAIYSATEKMHPEQKASTRVRNARRQPGQGRRCDRSRERSEATPGKGRIVALVRAQLRADVT
ncbi:hypothetical protein M885DRAFT_90441 [Pelagophyceae sp. CCMP2097]|nr:hypothetical protein M885DRAFT_90441 [Pelagophyceae sp. CCMP2097]